MKALVTGGAGFIGSTVVKYLLTNNWEVKVVDNLSSGHYSNIEKLNMNFIHGDITNMDILNDACKGIDVVFHLAASVGRQRSIDNPQLDTTTNVLGTINILESMRNNKIKKIVYSSSAAIFGELITSSIGEDHPQNADSPYGVSKLAAEKMILAYSKMYNIYCTCLRYFNIYGVNQRYDLYGNVIPIFAQKIYQNEPILIYGDGLQTRDFVNVKDIARINYLSAVNDQGANVYNIGSGISITINELAKMMQEIAGINNGIIYVKERSADVKHCRANNKKVVNNLGFVPEISLKEGLIEYLNWFKSKNTVNK